jgi:hypothetical protein
MFEILYNKALYDGSRFKRVYHADVDRRVIGESYGTIKNVFLSQIRIPPIKGAQLITQLRVESAYLKILSTADDSTYNDLFGVNPSIKHDQKIETSKRMVKHIEKELIATYKMPKKGLNKSIRRRLNRAHKKGLRKILIDQKAYVPIDETRIWFRTTQWQMALIEMERAGRKVRLYPTDKYDFSLPKWMKNAESLWITHPLYPCYRYGSERTDGMPYRL